jgi:hypothetical protein
MTRSQKRFNREDQSHEVCAEWNGDCCRPGHCRARVGANERADESIHAHPIRVGGRAYEDAQDH